MNGDDICYWPDGTWCFADDLEDYLAMMSDDYRVLVEGTPKWLEIIQM